MKQYTVEWDEKDQTWTVVGPHPSHGQWGAWATACDKSTAEAIADALNGVRPLKWYETMVAGRPELNRAGKLVFGVVAFS